MKKFYSISMLAVAAMAAISCAKEIEVNVEPEKVSVPKVISAYTDADVSPDTKTSLNGVTIEWASTDIIKGIDLSSVVHTSTSTVVSGDKKQAEFTFSDVTVEDDLLTLAYPAEKVTNIDADYVYATLPTTQTATVNSFANQANIAIADGGVAHPVFKNVGGLLSFTINNDDITSVTLSANESLTGGSKISTAAATFATPTILSGKNFVTVSGTIANGSTYYAVVYPGTYTGLKIEVRNSAGQVATYANPNSLTVARNGNLHIATLTIPGGKWVTPTKGDPYSWTLASGDLGSSETPATSVTKGSPSLTWNADWDFTGSNYIGNLNAYGLQIGSGTNPCESLVLKTSGYTGYIERVRINFTQAKDGAASVAVSVKDVTFKNGENTSASASDNTPANYDFTNTNLVQGDVEITFTNGAAKAFYIKSIEINPDLRTPQTLSFPQASYSVELSEGTYASPALSGANTSVTYSSDDEDIATVNASTGVVTLKAIGTVNITATAAEDEDYQEGSTSYELNITAGPSSIADVISSSLDSEVYTSGVVTQMHNKGFIISDGINNIHVYQNALPSVSAGDCVKVRGTRKAYNSVAQISSPTITTVATGQAITRTSQTVVTSANATGYTSNTYVSLSGTLTITANPYYNVSISGSTVKGSLYQVNGTNVYTAGLLSSLNGSSVIVSGYVVGSSASYLYIAVVDIAIDPSVAFLSTIPATGNTIEWDDDKYGSTYNETITIIQNGAATGYTVTHTGTENDWNIADNGAGTLTYSPKEANTSTTTDKTLTVTITHNDDGEKTSVITLKQKKQGGPTWTRVTSVSTLLGGGTFIMGYEADAKSGVIVPLRSKDCGATTTANGFFYTGKTDGSSTNGTIDMADLSEVNTSDFEVYISESSTSGRINIQRTNSSGNYYGSSSTGSSKNTARLYTSGNSNETNLIPEWASETNNQFKLSVDVTGEYKYLKYNTGSPRFAFYNSAGEKIVFYKKD